MMRWKRILCVALLVIAVLFVTAYSLFFCRDLNYLKPKIAQATDNSIGHQLKINGDIRLRPGFTPIIAVNGLVFQNAKWGPGGEWAKIKRLEVQVGLLPLIHGRIELKRLTLIEPHVLVETDRLGKWNLKFTSRKQPDQVPSLKEVPTVKESRLPFLEFNELRIVRGRFTYRDGQKGKSYSVLLDSFSAVTGDTENPVNLDFEGEYKDRSFKVQGTLSSLISLLDPNEICSVNLKTKGCGATLTVQGEIRDVFKPEGISASIVAEGRSIPEILRLANLSDVPDIGPFNVSFEVSDPDGRLTIERLKLEIGTEKSARIELSSDRVDPFALQGTVVSFRARGNDLTDLRQLIGRQLPLAGLSTFSGRLMVASRKCYKISNLKAVLGNGELSGWIEIDLAHNRPRFTAAMSSENLNLIPLFAAQRRAISEERQIDRLSGQRDRLFPVQPLCFDALNKADVKLKIRVRQMLLPGLVLNDFTAHMVLEDGCLVLKPFAFVIDGGTVNGYLYLSAQKSSTDIALGLRTKQFPFDRMLRELGVGFIVEGKLDGDIKLATRGSSVADLMAGLNGKTSLVMGKNTLDNKHIDLLGADLSSTLFRLLNPFRQEAGKTRVNCFVSRFDIKQGLARSTAMVLDTESVTVVGEGEIDLKTEKLDISFKPFPKKGLGISGIGKLSFSLGELAKPLKLTGTFAHPSLGIDATRTAVTVGKALGGMILFGPIGIAAVLAGSADGSENPCLCAIETVERRAEDSLEKEQKREKSVPEKPSRSIGQSIKTAFGGAHRKAKSFLGNLTKRDRDTSLTANYDYH